MLSYYGNYGNEIKVNYYATILKNFNESISVKCVNIRAAVITK